MTDVVSIKFKNRGKSYFFSPNGLTINEGDKVVVETAKGLEIADCTRGNHPVNDDAVIQPLRPVIRVATDDDLRVAEINKKREEEAFTICQQQIEKHKLDMKLVDVECNFEGNKTTFFFTSDGRVDFRDLVKDLAGIFRNRIELRQIGVRDEAKMLGGIGICGRPYCCNQFLEDFAPVSTKMAKTQSLSLNPAKISGSCGRLMCCLRYEEDAYEELVKHVPKQGAYVETKDGYGTAVQVNLLRQTVKVKLDEDSDDSLHVYKPNELAAVPGGRPRDGAQPPKVLNYVPEELNEDSVQEQDDTWSDIDFEPASTVAETESLLQEKEDVPVSKKGAVAPAAIEEKEQNGHRNSGNSDSRNRHHKKGGAVKAHSEGNAKKQETHRKEETSTDAAETGEKKPQAYHVTPSHKRRSPAQKNRKQPKQAAQTGTGENKPAGGKGAADNTRSADVKVSAGNAEPADGKERTGKAGPDGKHKAADAAGNGDGASKQTKNNSNHNKKHYYHHKPKPKNEGGSGKA